MNEERLFEALGDVGDDLLVMAENKKFVSPWRKWGQTAAILAVVVCLGVLALPYFPIGCGSSSESAAQVTMECTVEESAVWEEVEEAFDECVEETVEEIVEAEPQQTVDNGKMKQPRILTKAVCRGTYFYLEPLKEDMGVPPMGEELGLITDAEDPALISCRVFTVPYATWFTNYAVDGLPVTQMVVVQTPSGYRYGTTCNEKVVSRYTIDDVRQALNKENYQWLADTFVLPVERQGGVQFREVSELSSEELHTMFLASVSMNTGVTVCDYWYDDEDTYIVPASDVKWRLDRFLDEGYTYMPEETEAYDPEQNALVFDIEELVWDVENITVHGAALMDEDTLWMLIGLPDQKGVTKEYCIRFDEDSWRYEYINEIGPG